MPYPVSTRKFLETRALGPGEVRVRITKGDTLLYSKIGYKVGSGVFVEWLGQRIPAERYGQTWRLNIEKIAREECLS
jgi:hypothetical protein